MTPHWIYWAAVVCAAAALTLTIFAALKDFLHWADPQQGDRYWDPVCAI